MYAWWKGKERTENKSLESDNDKNEGLSMWDKCNCKDNKRKNEW